jgi:uncharacterized protein (DUF433 family)
MNRRSWRLRAIAVVAAVQDDLLGIGLYTPAEAALYARVPTTLLTRWLYGSAAGDAVLRPQRGGQDAERHVSFLDFVQALAIRAVRQEHKISLGKIRQAIQKAEQKHGLPYPFARQHVTYLLGDELIIKLRDDEYVQASGKHVDNRIIRQIAEFYMIDLSFSQKGLAELYRPFRLQDCRVILNPQVRFGEPLIESCGYSAYALWQSFRAEGSIEAAADVCGVTAIEVETACRYYDQILGRAAA